MSRMMIIQKAYAGSNISLGAPHTRADPVIGNFFEWRVGRNVIVRITLFRIVDVTTDRAFVLLHRFLQL